jgi:hypothetical protein
MPTFLLRVVATFSVNRAVEDKSCEILETYFLAKRGVNFCIVSSLDLRLVIAPTRNSLSREAHLLFSDLLSVRMTASYPLAGAYREG